MSNNGKLFGIDFGTTNSSLAIVDGDKVFHYGENDKQPLRSVVATNTKTSEVLVGVKAISKLGKAGWNVNFSSKIDLSKEENKEATKQIINRLKDVAKENDHDLTEAVLSVPVEFKDIDKKILRGIAREVGINVLSFTNEPISAYFSLKHKTKGAKGVVVFDWGGGTLDISVLEITTGKVSECLKKGLKVAGDDIDRQLAENFHSKILKFKDKYSDVDEISRIRLERAIEQAKIELSGKESATISNLNDYGKHGTVPVKSISREWLESVIANIVNEAMTLLKELVIKAKQKGIEIDKIVLTGGSSNIPMLREKLEVEFPGKLIMPDNDSSWDVSHGSAIMNRNKVKIYSNEDIYIKLAESPCELDIFEEPLYMPLIAKNEMIGICGKGAVKNNGEFKYKEFEFETVDASSLAKLIIPVSK